MITLKTRIRFYVDLGFILGLLGAAILAYII